MTVSGGSVRLEIMKGKKPLSVNDVRVSERDARRLTRFMLENF